LLKRVQAYYRELEYIIKSSGNLRTCGALIARCALFHLNNRFGRRRFSRPFRAIVKLGPRHQTELLLRTFNGDLFVLFEVLAEESYHIPEELLRRESVRVILDCGANIGLTSLYLAVRYPNAQIYSVEPDSSNFELLCVNSRHEPRITPLRAAVVGQPRDRVYMTTNTEAWRSHIAEDGKGAGVQAVTVEEICARYQLSKIDLLKMDIEGEEVNVFARGEFLHKVRFVIVELHGEYDYAEFATDMAARGLTAAQAGAVPGLRLTSAWREQLLEREGW
jgi:FkbM family methyltransferase